MNTAIWDWAKRQGLATILVLVGVGFFAGWIPSPLSTIATVLSYHAVQMEHSMLEARYQTALLAVVCRKMASPDECLTALMKEHQRDLHTSQMDTFTFRGPDQSDGVSQIR